MFLRRDTPENIVMDRKTGLFIMLDRVAEENIRKSFSHAEATLQLSLSQFL